ncbi:SDR family NAD(P)-dependent oxidoreductase [Nocardiopsis lambiniae]|uniref:SDR family oxidoreductase n=1 Tax=Nocardiopsis lambiniae TaxID=3075539 RepID=A0ABU2MBG4_9ACTN|nr:SDR family oxidoreductase [Nocardiopsis sp. DSM 44743]MDT0329920.1 SDR family oxidoreductase [Nocardiopsis sp. DSM 44743]
MTRERTSSIPAPTRAGRPRRAGLARRGPAHPVRALALAGGVALAGGAALAGRRARSGHEPGLVGRTALITGGSRGLGLQLAREFGARGASVVVCARDAEEVDRAVEDLRGRGVTAHGERCDLTDPEQARALVGRAVAHLGHLDFVVNNAGIIQVGPYEVFSERHFHEAMDTMFWAPLRVSLAALEPLRHSGGRLVTITSIGGHLSVPHLLPYSCAKFAEVALSEGLAAEAARTGVGVTTVVPGLMRTGSHRAAVFVGRPEREYTWFSLGAGLPLVSVGAERAAARIVEAAARGRGHVVLTPLARLVILSRGISPAFVQGVTRLMAAVLPTAPAHPEERKGAQADHGALNTLIKAPTVLNERAGRRLHQDRPASRR